MRDWATWLYTKLYDRNSKPPGLWVRRRPEAGLQERGTYLATSKHHLVSGYSSGCTISLLVFGMVVSDWIITGVNELYPIQYKLLLPHRPEGQLGLLFPPGPREGLIYLNFGLPVWAREQSWFCRNVQFVYIVIDTICFQSCTSYSIVEYTTMTLWLCSENYRANRVL